MNLGFLKSIGGPTVQRGLYKVSKYAPEILTGVGIAGVVASTILIGRVSYTKAGAVVEDYSQRIKDVKRYRDEDEDYAANNYRKDLTLVYARGSVDFFKLYGPAVTLSIGSIISILAAHGIMKRRVVTLVGAYKALEASYNAYRARVIEEYGEEKDRDFHLGLRTEKLKDPETGKQVSVRTFDFDHQSKYAKFFDEGNENYKRDPEYNLLFLKQQQNWANDKLRLRGFLFLNEVYRMLGLKETEEGQLVGWMMDPQHGDCYVDFNIYNADSERARAFVNGLEASILLDFNVDGLIIDRI